MVATDDGRAAVVEALACLLLEALDAEARQAAGDEERGARGGLDVKAQRAEAR
jgi:hypothetical protein